MQVIIINCGEKRLTSKRNENSFMNLFVLLFLTHASKNVMFFFLSLLQNLRTGARNRSCPGGLAAEGRGWWQGKGIEGCIQCKRCVHMHINAKMIHIETVP
jgi:hypothetical protein